eukprot:GHVL01044123.1.p1 GENE.GHVL01044123.1~~GHVL01044123.1.p1  ORF type:complete len:284 (-),score=13.17 GHVL01044123.1:15-866(-)
MFRVLLCLFIDIIFVCSLYIWEYLGFCDNHRDHAAAIMRRFMGVSLVSALSMYIVHLTVARKTSLLTVLGVTVSFNIFPLILICLSLYSGAIFYFALVKSSNQLNLIVFSTQRGSWIMLRDVILAPVVEEIVFRACFIPILLSSSLSPATVVFLAPLLFGLAHAHHIFENAKAGGIIEALVTFACQIAYTTVFGCLVSYLFIQSGSIFPSLLLHCFCNFWGLPPLNWVFEDKYVPKIIFGKRFSVKKIRRLLIIINCLSIAMTINVVFRFFPYSTIIVSSKLN